VGQKVNPIGFRIGVYFGWDSRWCVRDSKEYARLLAEDLAVRDFIKKNLRSAEIGRVEIERAGDAVRIVLHSARPGVVIGKKGQEIETLRQRIAKLVQSSHVEVSVQEVKKPELCAAIAAQSIAEQLERRASFKKVAKKAAANALRAGAKGVKIRIAGRLGGAEIARDEWLRIGSVPLHTLRADIDYGVAEALTTYGIIGVKVWICKGEHNLV
jgi:small subunit ribosomal protein S3